MKKKHILWISIWGLVFCLLSCKNSYKIDLSDIPTANTTITRYEEALFTQPLTAFYLDSLQQHFPLFLGTDSLSAAQINQLQAYAKNPFLDSLFQASQKRFPNLKTEEKALASAFQHIKYYYPNFQYPQVYSYISGSFDDAFIEDTTLVISIDRFLGPNCPLYTQAGTPQYQQRAMQSNYIVRNVLKVLSKHFIPPVNHQAQLLDHMLYEAKTLLFIQHMQPNITAEVLFDQSTEHITWLQNKESALWRYYAENELLFKSKHTTYTKCIANAPFSSIFGQGSAPRTGIWLGYQILLAYQKHNKLSLQEVLQETNSHSILQKSTYKPN